MTASPGRRDLCPRRFQPNLRRVSQPKLTCFVPRANNRTVPISAVTRSEFKSWKSSQPATTQRWLESIKYKPDHGSVAVIPSRDGSITRAVIGLGAEPRMWDFAAAASTLPVGRYSLERELTSTEAEAAALAWSLASYSFRRYTQHKTKVSKLVWPADADRDAVRRCYEATALARDLINTPAGDLGPAELANAAAELAERHNASCSQIVGTDLVEQGYPAVYAVGKASSRAPRLIDIHWGDKKAPKLTLVGKGVCFDTGGLDLKSAGGMKLMKKDMGGAAMILGLAHMIMDAELPVRLRVLVPAVENSVSGEAYRPGDVINTRKGLTVEIGNTDAEGRLILADALAEASEDKPDLLVDAATLTGAARVALGTELPALFSTDDAWARDIIEHGDAQQDALWRMPLFAPYNRHLDSKIADLNNMSSVAQGGAITAALFLQHFVAAKVPWIHIDTMGWNPTSRPGRPAGGEVFGMRALFSALTSRYGAAT